MVLSRMVLNPDCSAVRRDLADKYELHSTLMRLVDEGASKPLWRLETGRNTQNPTLLIQTESEPDPSGIRTAAEDYYLEFGSRSNVLFRNLQDGDEFNFRLRANPTVTREGKRHGLVQESDQINWLSKQLQKAGSQLMYAHTSEVSRERLKRQRGRPPITLLGVTFDGVLKVTDSGNLTSSIKHGFGHAKAFGFGLLTLAQ